MKTVSQLSRALRPLAVPVVVAAVALSGCGGTEEATPADETGQSTDDTGDATADHNDADVTFARDMIPHHAQALMMTDMAIGRQLSQEFVILVDNIRAAQAPEIELMADWLQEWGEPVPETVRDHANGGHDGGHGGDDGGGDMPEMSGMMTEEQLAELEDAPRAEFEDLWLTMMIEHHEGAVTMAETELEEGAYQPALDLAEDIVSSQTEEIEQMQAMLEE
jgi:uncharacterized protein (DUF305 family)